MWKGPKILRRCKGVLCIGLKDWKGVLIVRLKLSHNFFLAVVLREENGQPVTLFFDMDACGLSNMDLEFTRYLIGLFKQYYPYSLNYILIFEMAWILNGKVNYLNAMTLNWLIALNLCSYTTNKNHLATN